MQLWTNGQTPPFGVCRVQPDGLMHAMPVSCLGSALLCLSTWTKTDDIAEHSPTHVTYMFIL